VVSHRLSWSEIEKAACQRALESWFDNLITAYSQEVFLHRIHKRWLKWLAIQKHNRSVSPSVKPGGSLPFS
jgi:hypothetical protein